MTPDALAGWLQLKAWQEVAEKREEANAKRRFRRAASHYGLTFKRLNIVKLADDDPVYRLVCCEETTHKHECSGLAAEAAERRAKS